MIVIFAEPRPYADPEKAARRLVEIASTHAPEPDLRAFRPAGALPFA